MSESGDFDPGVWSGYSFASARRAFDDQIDRSYNDAVAAGVSRVDCVPDRISTDSESPLIILTDGTGSMGTWTGTIMSKLGYLDLEGQEYLGPTMQICYGVIGDCYSDRYPLQIQPFTAGTDMKEAIAKLIIEGGGGGSGQESYDLGALYVLKNCDCPKAIRKPILVFIGDEGLYNFVDQGKAKEWARFDLAQRMTPTELFTQLTEKFSVYVVLKPYDNSYNTTINEISGENKAIFEQWAGLVGRDHVAILPDPNRVVDVIFGLLANETGRIEYFEDELKDRQLKDQGGQQKVDIVLKSLMTVHTKASVKKLPKPTTSVTRRPDGESSPRSKSLL